jgi:hypothetical protein
VYVGTTVTRGYPDNHHLSWQKENSPKQENFAAVQEAKRFCRKAGPERCLSMGGRGSTKGFPGWFKQA